MIGQEKRSLLPTKIWSSDIVALSAVEIKTVEHISITNKLVMKE